MLKIEDFEIREIPEELKGLTADLLWNIWDIVTNFGTLDIPNQRVDFRHELKSGEKVGISASIKGGPDFIIGKTPVFTGTLPIALKNGGVIMWDEQLSLTIAKILVAEVDALAWESGLINKTNGARIKTISFKKSSAKRYRVAEVFKTRGSLMPVFPTGPSAEELINMFDEPQKLMVVNDTLFQLKSIALKADADYLERRRQIVLQLLAEQELDISDIGKIDADKIIELREEVNRRLSNTEDVGE